MPELEKLLTEQRNPASAEIDTLPTEEVLRIVNAEDHRVAAAVEARFPPSRARWMPLSWRSRRGGRLFYIGAGPAGGWACSTLRNARPRSACRRRWCRNHRRRPGGLEPRD